jgi:hypothetical protein
LIGFLQKRQERPSFLKKRSKKLLLLEVHAGGRSATAIKSFLLLFFKKEGLPYLPRRKPRIWRVRHARNADRMGHSLARMPLIEPV